MFIQELEIPTRNFSRTNSRRTGTISVSPLRRLESGISLAGIRSPKAFCSLRQPLSFRDYVLWMIVSILSHRKRIMSYTLRLPGYTVTHVREGQKMTNHTPKYNGLNVVWGRMQVLLLSGAGRIFFADNRLTKRSRERGESRVIRREAVYSDSVSFRTERKRNC